MTSCRTCEVKEARINSSAAPPPNKQGSKPPVSFDAESAIGQQLELHTSGTRDAKLCLACAFPKKDSVCCERHKRVYECTYRQATNEKTSQDQRSVFAFIFGVRGKGMRVMIAIRVVLDFRFRSPESLVKAPYNLYGRSQRRLSLG